MLDFDSHQVEVDLSEDAVLQVELALVELELNVEAFLDADLHFNRLVGLRLLALVADNELFLLGDFIIVPVDDDVDVVPQPYHDAVVGLELLLNSVELEVVRNILGQCAGRFQVPNDLQKYRILVLVVQILYHSY